MSKELGKIVNVDFGLVRGCFLGIGLELSYGGSMGVYVSKLINMSPECEWDTPTQKAEYMNDLMESINTLLTDAKVDDISKLVGKPICVSGGGLGTVMHWDDFRILTEVI